MNHVIDFLSELKDNNNREWFNQNRDRYEAARGEFEMLMNRIIPGIQTFDSEIAGVTAKQAIFRIFRDVRFSKDKSPYKTNFGGFISKGGRKGGHAGYYIHIDPSGSFLAGGSYMPPPGFLKKFRQEIYFNIDEFKKIILSNDFRQAFGNLEGEKLSRPPKDFPADFPDIDLLKFKSYIVMHSLDNRLINKPDLIEYILDIFNRLAPLNHFLNRALS
ncbi:MAG: DUF2461 domain-containing protein [Bacteroidales bacterium]|nr:DUF2461 domain-containing protein [Bacteroidales bacterium]